ncbi:MAG: hypothetical protein Ta2G_12190 [Termitinemataceae bacterium]|nr:MAG: hypothetical protein Ta2G_12190 [Termitinemataceae bacterium]
MDSCNAAEKVLDLSKKSAESRLQKKQLVFLLDAKNSRLSEIARIDPSAPFYAALLLQEAGGEEEKIKLLLETATASPVVHNIAVEKLIPMDPDKYFEEFNKTTLMLDGTDWEKAFSIVSKLIKQTVTVQGKNQREEFKTEILDFFLKNVVGKPQRWAYAKLKSENQPLNDLNILQQAQISAITAHFAIADRSYAFALRNFKNTIGENPSLFFNYKELLTDLGKAYQYASPKEGSEMFTRLAASLDKVDMSKSDFTKDEALYLLLYYGGRMLRQSKLYDEAEVFFVKAMKAAPNSLQKDACIWYLIDSAWTQSRAKAISALNTYGAQWTDSLYFSDILEKISLYYTSRKKWDVLPEFFPPVLKYADDETVAKYAYLIGRAYSTKLISAEKASLALKGSKRPDNADKVPKPEEFYTIAYNCKDYRGTAYTPFYYHALASKELFKHSNFKLPKISESSQKDLPLDKKGNPIKKDNIIFLENFFRFGCADKAYPYIKAMSSQLGVEELRSFAEKLAENNRYGDSLRLSLGYIGRKEYVLDRRDLEFCYPRAFKDVVDSVSKITGMESSLLYALMRTESIFIPDIVSHAGAMGLTQLMPATGTEMARTLKRYTSFDYLKEDETVDFFNPKINVHLGAAYYIQLYERTGSRLLSLLAYNGGIGRVNRWRKANRDLSEDLFLETIELTETREYGKKVLAAEAVYKFLYE